MGISLAVDVPQEELVEALVDSPNECAAILADLSVSWDDDAQFERWMGLFRAAAKDYGDAELRCLYGLLTCMGVEILAAMEKGGAR